MTAPKTTKPASTPPTPSPSYPTPIFQPIEPPAPPIAAPVNQCQHDLRQLGGAIRCALCGFQPYLPEPKPQEGLTERQRLLQGFPLTRESSMSFDLLKWRNWRIH
jgi:hypothetical protein